MTPCTLGPGIATIVGGSTYQSDQPFADMPAGPVFQNRFLAAGPTSTQPSTMTFSGAGVDYVSFLWGSPEMFNQLTVNSTAGSQLFTAVALGLTLGDESYVEFDANPGVFLTSLVFNNIPAINAFETANFSITESGPTGVVPEPTTYALLLAGLVGLACVSRRSRKTAVRARR